MKCDEETVKELFRSLSHLDSRGIPKALKEVGETIHSMAVDAFVEQQSPEGERWEESKRAKKEGGKTLVDTATLQNSLSVSADAGQVTVGSNMVYAAIHQLGGQAGRGHRLHLPARPFLPDVEGKVLRTEVLEIVAEHLRRIVRKR